MGMDVYGKNPSAKSGEYFRANVLSWRPIWAMTKAAAPELISDKLYESGQYNDGAGLKTARECKALAARIRGSDWKATLVEWNRQQEAEPDESCDICGGTGKRRPPPAIGPGKVHCNGCDGKGARRPLSARYQTSEDHFEEWITFLDTCGGFEIC